uniref:Uncharacterized protein n=1 Tax=Anguilla anguilla TaxID=7936 RepID=A0A0E9WSX5_ANGAN
MAEKQLICKPRSEESMDRRQDSTATRYIKCSSLEKLEKERNRWWAEK